MCGVVGLIGSPDAAREAFLGLTTLQHRGQDAAGILTYDGSRFHHVKNVGLVENVFTKENVETLQGDLAIGHTRYSTIGRAGNVLDVQPFLVNYPFGVGLAHNGNVVNCDELADNLKKNDRRHLLTHSDSEIILNLLAKGLALAKKESGDDSEKLYFDDVCSAVKDVCATVNGAYSIVSMIGDHGLLAFRDPYGIRPLVWGKRKNPPGSAKPEAHMVASESVALNFNDFEVVRDLEPGEVLFVSSSGKVYHRVIDQRKPRHCMFEWVYFSSPESVIDGIPVYRARINLGQHLGKLVKEKLAARGLKADVVVPVPDSARVAAIALAETIGVPYRETLIKNRYIKRTFILETQEKRQKAVNLKLSPVRSEMEGKDVLLVDDSIVRGTTSKKLIELVRKAGARKVYFVSTCPPIKHPCFYGLDFPSEGELLAYERSVEQIEKELGADVVIYQDLPGLAQAIGEAGDREPGFQPCMACLDGKYPTDVSAGKRFAKTRQQDRAIRS